VSEKEWTLARINEFAQELKVEAEAIAPADRLGYYIGRLQSVENEVARSAMETLIMGSDSRVPYGAPQIQVNNQPQTVITNSPQISQTAAPSVSQSDTPQTALRWWAKVVVPLLIAAIGGLATIVSLWFQHRPNTAKAVTPVDTMTLHPSVPTAPSAVLPSAKR
jgi:hypothetical protein